MRKRAVPVGWVFLACVRGRSFFMNEPETLEDANRMIRLLKARLIEALETIERLKKEDKP